MSPEKIFYFQNNKNVDIKARRVSGQIFLGYAQYRNIGEPNNLKCFGTINQRA
jgi:hypothetical protein